MSDKYIDFVLNKPIICSTNDILYKLNGFLMRMINSVADIKNLQKDNNGGTLSDNNKDNGSVMGKECPTIQLREFSRNVSKYLGGRYDIIGRGGIVAKIFPSSYSEVESSFTEEDRGNLEYAAEKIEEIKDFLNKFNV